MPAATQTGDRVVVGRRWQRGHGHCRTALAWVAKEVTVVYRRSRAEMPANPWRSRRRRRRASIPLPGAPVSVKADGKKGRGPGMQQDAAWASRTRAAQTAGTDTRLRVWNSR